MLSQWLPAWHSVLVASLITFVLQLLKVLLNDIETDSINNDSGKRIGNKPSTHTKRPNTVVKVEPGQTQDLPTALPSRSITGNPPYYLSTTEEENKDEEKEPPTVPKQDCAAQLRRAQHDIETKDTQLYWNVVNIKKQEDLIVDLRKEVAFASNRIRDLEEEKEILSSLPDIADSDEAFVSYRTTIPIRVVECKPAIQNLEEIHQRELETVRSERDHWKAEYINLRRAYNEQNQAALQISQRESHPTVEAPVVVHSEAPVTIHSESEDAINSDTSSHHSRRSDETHGESIASCHSEHADDDVHAPTISKTPEEHSMGTVADDEENSGAVLHTIQPEYGDENRLFDNAYDSTLPPAHVKLHPLDVALPSPPSIPASPERLLAEEPKAFHQHSSVFPDTETSPPPVSFPDRMANEQDVFPGQQAPSQSEQYIPTSQEPRTSFQEPMDENSTTQLSLPWQSLEQYPEDVTNNWASSNLPVVSQQLVDEEPSMMDTSGMEVLSPEDVEMQEDDPGFEIDERSILDYLERFEKPTNNVPDSHEMDITMSDGIQDPAQSDDIILEDNVDWDSWIQFPTEETNVESNQFTGAGTYTEPQPVENQELPELPMSDLPDTTDFVSQLHNKSPQPSPFVSDRPISIDEPTIQPGLLHAQSDTDELTDERHHDTEQTGPEPPQPTIEFPVAPPFKPNKTSFRGLFSDPGTDETPEISTDFGRGRLSSAKALADSKVSLPPGHPQPPAPGPLTRPYNIPGLSLPGLIEAGRQKLDPIDELLLKSASSSDEDSLAGSSGPESPPPSPPPQFLLPPPPPQNKTGRADQKPRLKISLTPPRQRVEITVEVDDPPQRNTNPSRVIRMPKSRFSPATRVALQSGMRLPPPDTPDFPPDSPEQQPPAPAPVSPSPSWSPSPPPEEAEPEPEPENPDAENDPWTYFGGVDERTSNPSNRPLIDLVPDPKTNPDYIEAVEQAGQVTDSDELPEAQQDEVESGASIYGDPNEDIVEF